MLTYIDPPDFTKTYASAGALTEDVDLYTEGENKVPVRIRIGVGGTLHVVYFDSKEDTITYQSGDIDELKIKTIKSDSTAQLITVYW